MVAGKLESKSNGENKYHSIYSHSYKEAKNKKNIY